MDVTEPASALRRELAEYRELTAFAQVGTDLVAGIDNQTFFETELVYTGIRPTANGGLSVSRVSSATEIKVAGALQRELARVREVATLTQFGADLKAGTGGQPCRVLQALGNVCSHSVARWRPSHSSVPALMPAITARPFSRRSCSTRACAPLRTWALRQLRQTCS